MKIKDVATYIKRGITPKYVDKDGLIVVNQKCIKDGTINHEFVKYTSKDKKFSDEKKIQVGDILINSTGTGTLGRVAYADKKLGFSYVDSHVTILRCENYNPKFLFYWLRPLEKYIETLGKGSTNQIELSSDIISEIEIPAIDIIKQNKITEIVSKYDDLIENNQKQIKLLEEAAQRLYKEWFVDFRFPGYEDTKFIDGIPDGWRKHKIDDVFKIKYGKTLSTSKINKTGKYPVYGANGIIGFYNEKNCSDCVVLITSRGNGSGDVSRTYNKESFVTNNSFIVNPFNKSYRLSYVHQLIKTINFKNICTGSAQPQLTNNSISMLSVMVASDELVGRFCDVGDLLYEKIDNILKQNILLTQARDRLLPKLMSGEIEV